MIATNRVACLVMARPCCMGSSTVESVDTKWSCSTNMGRATTATTLRQQYRVPVCQDIPADPVDLQVVESFFQALSPVELDVYAAARRHTSTATAQQIAHAQQQHLERLRYEAALAQRQFTRVDPDNRLVAAELEKRWEAALAELKQAEEAQAIAIALPLLLLLSARNCRRPFKPSGSICLPCGNKDKSVSTQKSPVTRSDRQGGGASTGP